MEKPEKCCYPNCFECPYADCLYDGYEKSDANVSKSLDSDCKCLDRKRADKQKAYRERQDKDKAIQYQKTYYELHKEERKAYQREYYMKNKDAYENIELTEEQLERKRKMQKIRRSTPEYKAKQKEYIREYMRKYRAKKKQECVL